MDFVDVWITTDGDIRWQPVLALSFMEIADRVRAQGYDVLVGGLSPDGSRRMIGTKRKVVP